VRLLRILQTIASLLLLDYIKISHSETPRTSLDKIELLYLLTQRALSIIVEPSLLQQGLAAKCPFLPPLGLHHRLSGDFFCFRIHHVNHRLRCGSLRFRSYKQFTRFRQPIARLNVLTIIYW